MICDECPGVFPRQHQAPAEAQMPGGHMAANRSLSVTVPSCSESSAHPCLGLRGAESGPGRHALPSTSVPREDPAHTSADKGTGPLPATLVQWPRAPGHWGQAGGRVFVGKDGAACQPQSSEALSTPLGQPQSRPRMTTKLGATTAPQGILKS